MHAIITEVAAPPAENSETLIAAHMIRTITFHFLKLANANPDKVFQAMVDHWYEPIC
jgi:hypothetical protein